MIIVAAATIYTVELLMAEASATGMHDYGTLSKAIGGTWYKVHLSDAAQTTSRPLCMLCRSIPLGMPRDIFMDAPSQA